jgi:hypothetical protein
MPKIATITAISTRFASEIVKIDQVRYLPGGLRSTAIAPWTARVAALPPAHAEKKSRRGGVAPGHRRRRTPGAQAGFIGN